MARQYGLRIMVRRWALFHLYNTHRIDNLISPRALQHSRSKAAPWRPSHCIWLALESRMNGSTWYPQSLAMHVIWPDFPQFNSVFICDPDFSVTLVGGSGCSGGSSWFPSPVVCLIAVAVAGVEKSAIWLKPKEKIVKQHQEFLRQRSCCCSGCDGTINKQGGQISGPQCCREREDIFWCLFCFLKETKGKLCKLFQRYGGARRSETYR